LFRSNEALDLREIEEVEPFYDPSHDKEDDGPGT
jgi:hypothetical protein